MNSRSLPGPSLCFHRPSAGHKELYSFSPAPRLLFPLLAALVFAAAGPSARAEEEQGILEAWRLSRTANKADRLFHEGKYERARAEYMRGQDLAGENTPAAQKLHFNIGATLYKQGNYDEAEKEFKKVLASPDLKLREMAHYNLGNIYFKKGLQAGELSLLEKAVEQYQKALELNPDDQEAKFNIEVVRRHLKMKKQPPPPSQGPSCPNPKTGSQQKPAKGQQEKKSQPEKEKKKKPGEKQPQPGQEQKQKPSAPSPAEGSTAGGRKEAPVRPVKPAGSTKKEGELSKEEAERLLNALQESEKDALKEFLEYHSRQRVKKDKDW